MHTAGGVPAASPPRASQLAAPLAKRGPRVQAGWRVELGRARRSSSGTHPKMADQGYRTPTPCGVGGPRTGQLLAALLSVRFFFFFHKPRIADNAPRHGTHYLDRAQRQHAHTHARTQAGCAGVLIMQGCTHLSAGGQRARRRASKRTPCTHAAHTHTHAKSRRPRGSRGRRGPRAAPRTPMRAWASGL